MRRAQANGLKSKQDEVDCQPRNACVTQVSHMQP